MKEFDGNWNFDRSEYVVCNRFHGDVLMIMTRKEWSTRNKLLRESDQSEWIEKIR